MNFAGRRLKRTNEQRFLENGARLLGELISSCDGRVRHPICFFSASEIKEIIANCAEWKLLGGRGSFTKYKGLYKGQPVFIKKAIILDDNQESYMRHIDYAVNEIVMLSQINHGNVVKLLGCCLEAESPSLAYELIPNGSLSHSIHGHGLSRRISWEIRLRIATQIADALSYLHLANSKPILHRDIKSLNILLDEHYNPKLVDFEIAVSIPPGQNYVESSVVGTLGYLDPEYVRTGKLSEKSDVFSFGVVLLELLTGKRALNMSTRSTWLGRMVISAMENDCLGSVLEAEILRKGNMEQLITFAELALRCVSEKGDERPTMKEVATELRLIGKMGLLPKVAGALPSH
ncbi:hypothetical protein ACLOJK_029097 [Asimina triloba]